MPRKKTPAEKLAKQKEPTVKTTPKGRMLIPASGDLRDAIRAIPEGRIATVTQIRHNLAAAHNADYTCPLVTGIFLRLLAEATEEGYEEWACPWWRVVDDGGKLREKYPAAPHMQAERLRKEEHDIDTAKKKWRVLNWQTRLIPNRPRS